MQYKTSAVLRRRVLFAGGILRFLSLQSRQLFGGKLLLGAVVLGLCGLLLVGMLGAGNRHHAVALAQAHHAHTRTIAALHVDILHMHADDDALQADENDIVGVVDDLKPRDVAFAAVVPDSQAAAVLGSVIPHVRAPPLAFFRNGEHRCALTYDTHAHNAVALFQADGADACGRAAQRTGVVLTDADGHAVPRRNDQLVFAAGDTSPRKESPSFRLMAISPFLRMLL